MISQRCWLALAFLPIFGCARAETASDRQLVQMQETLTKVQAERDALDHRVAELEVEKSQKPTAPEPKKGPVATPELKVVRLTPPEDKADSAAPGTDADDNAVRPTIRLTGTPGPVRRRPRSDGRSDGRSEERVEPSTDDGGPTRAPLGERNDISALLGESNAVPSGAPTGGHADLGPDVAALSAAGGKAPSALDPEAKRAYDAALALVFAKKFDAGLDAFAAFLLKWPDHPYADNAIYWRGECYFAKGEFSHAAEQFEGAIARFPLGNKAPDSLLKLALCEDKLGAPDKAKHNRERLLRDYPRSEPAKRLLSKASRNSGMSPEETL